MREITLDQLAAAFLSKTKAAEYCGLSVRSLDYARARKQIPYYRHGVKIVFRVSDLSRYMERYRVEADATATEGQ
ncbi:MAG: helix-turn-helix domain-containing protein [Verrucomicrobia bacterium]|nr:helix-turn-helix domain-containing protein [Verrucomicrobiota bacterium]